MFWLDGLFALMTNAVLAESAIVGVPPLHGRKGAAAAVTALIHLDE